MEIPCDMSKTSFCTSPGSAYPWSAVRRYIYENQGFIRRMYGDQRQSVILKNEIDEIREKYDNINLYNYGKSFVVKKGKGLSVTRSEAKEQLNEQPSTNATPPDSATSGQSTYTNLSNTTVSSETTEVPDTDSDFSEDDTTTTESASILTKETNDVLPSPQIYSDILSSEKETSIPSPTEEASEEPKKGVNACSVKEEVLTQTNFTIVLIIYLFLLLSVTSCYWIL